MSMQNTIAQQKFGGCKLQMITKFDEYCPMRK